MDLGSRIDSALGAAPLVEAAEEDSNVEFFKKRKSGAAKIATEAAAKGGPSQLTAWHFKAKSKPYDQVIDAIKHDKPKQFYVDKCRSVATKLTYGNSQKRFQELMGELEVWGEAAAKLFGG